MKALLYAIFIIFPYFIHAGDNQPSRPTVCLNMIVKNESHVITRCLTSALPIIDYWVIVDTGSTDGTQQIIKDFMQKNEIPGDLYERPWVNFSHNRNEALQLARGKADYLCFMDADDYLAYDPDFQLPHLDKDYYYGSISFSGMRYSRIQLASTRLDFKWVGVLHEALVPPASASHATLEKMCNIVTTEGARSKDPQKFQKDAQILEAALKEEPDNMRYVFYLAQSYRDAGDHTLALKNYEKRAAMGGWDQEVFWSLLQVGILQEALDMPSESIIQSYNKAYQYRSSRAEPLYYMAQHFRFKEKYQAGYQVAKVAQTLPVSHDGLFVQKWMYDYGIPLELSICAYWIDKFEECQQISEDLLKRKDLPDNIRTCVENNLGFAKAKVNAKMIDQLCNSQ